MGEKGALITFSSFHAIIFFPFFTAASSTQPAPLRSTISLFLGTAVLLLACCTPPPTFSSGRKSKEKGRERLVKTCSPLQKSPSLLLLSLVSGRRSPPPLLSIDRWRLLSTLRGGRRERERAFLPSLSLSTRTRPPIRPRVEGGGEPHTEPGRGRERHPEGWHGMARWREEEAGLTAQTA